MNNRITKFLNMLESAFVISAVPSVVCIPSSGNQRTTRISSATYFGQTVFVNANWHLHGTKTMKHQIQRGRPV